MTTRKALLIGVPEYDSDKISNLPFVRQDMEALQAALESSDYQVDSVGLDSQVGASRSTIQRQIRQFCQTAHQGDAYILYFIGHGLHHNGKDYLVPKDAYFDDAVIEEESLLPVDLGEILKKPAFNAAATVFFIDACREGIIWDTDDKLVQENERSQRRRPSSADDVEAIRIRLKRQDDKERLIYFCYDHPNFSAVYAGLRQNLGINEIIDRILHHAEQQTLLDDLFALADEEADQEINVPTPIPYIKHLRYAQHWGERAPSTATDNTVVYLFASQPGQTSQAIGGSESFSLFAHSLAKVMDADHPAITFAEIKDGAQKHLLDLSAQYGTWQQALNQQPASDYLNAYQLANGPDRIMNKQNVDNSWVRKASASDLWQASDVANHATTPDLKATVKFLVSTCYEAWREAAQAIKQNIWRDEQFPVRVIERLEFLIMHCSTSLNQGPNETALSPAETTLLLVAPFLLEAVLANAISEAAKEEPLNLTESGATQGIRGMLEKSYQSRPYLVRKARHLLDQQKQADHDAIAIWLLYRCLLRLPEVWKAQSEGGYLSASLIKALAQAGRTCQFAATQETLTQARLLELAHCVYTDPERIDRLDILHAKIDITPGTGHEQRVREKLLAHLLMLAGRMATDVRMHSEILVDHIGLNNIFALTEIVQTASEARWLPDAQGRSLHVVCSHPALHLAFQEYAQNVNTVLERLQRKVHEKQDGLEILDRLPYHFTENGIQAVEFGNGKLAYEKPLLHFQLAQNQVRELLMGEQLYGDPRLAIRELYQNALDACRYRLTRTLYLERINAYNRQAWEGHIIFRQGVEAGRPFIECEDNGIGMGWRELTDAFSQAGRRFSDMPEFIEEQAEWFQLDPDLKLYPNSQFGVGVLSYFMLADELEIETCRLARDGRTGGQTFQVQIAGSGSLFRITTSALQREAGTRIRLYLNQNENRGRVSCLDTLKELLWIAQFKTEVREGGRTEIWLPDQLNTPVDYAGVLPSGHPDVWWVKSIRYRPQDDPWQPEQPKENGRLLADGLVTNEKLPGVIVNLTQGYQPKLTVDRTRIVKWDKQYVGQLLRQHTSTLFAHPEWISFKWLWSLEIFEAHTVEYIIDRLTEQDPAIKLPVEDTSNIFLPLKEIGCFAPDEGVIDFARTISVFPSLEGLSINMKGQIAQALFDIAIPPWLLSYRIILLAQQGLEFPDWTIELMGKILPSGKMPNMVPGDYIILMKYLEYLPGERIINRWYWGQIPIGHILCVAEKLNEPVGNTLQRLARLLPLSLKFSKIGHQNTLDLQMTPEDLLILSWNFNSKAPWIDNKILDIHILRIAEKLNEPVGNTLQRLAQFAPLGLKLPDIDHQDLLNLDVTPEDLIILSRDFDGKGPWVSNEISGIHILLAAEKLNEPVEKILQRLAHFAPLGLELPDIDHQDLLNLDVIPEDLIILSRNFDGKGPWVSDEISGIHLLLAAEKLNEPVRKILQRLEPFVPLGLELPDIVYQDLLDLQVTSEDLLILSQNFDGKSPWVFRKISSSHILRASEKLNESVGSTLRRLEGLVPLGLKLPDIFHQDLLDLQANQEDFLLLSPNLNNSGHWIEDDISFTHILIAAGLLNKPIHSIIKRLARFAPLGIELPNIVYQDLLDIQATSEDLLILSCDLDGVGSWVDRKRIVGHLLLLATMVFEGSIAEAIRYLKALGIGRNIDLASIEDLKITFQDLILFSEEFDGKGYFEDDFLPIGHLICAAKRIRLPISYLIDRFSQFVPLGLKMPEVNRGALTEVEILREDLILLSEKLDGQHPWTDNQVPIGHLVYAAQRLKRPIREIVQHLEKFIPLGLKLPTIPGDFKEPETIREDLVLLSEDLDGKPSWIDNQVSINHIVKAAKKRKKTISEVLQRLDRFVPLSLQMPPLHQLDLQQIADRHQAFISLSRYLSKDYLYGDQLTAVDIVCAARGLAEPMPQIMARMSCFDLLGLRVPALDMDRLAEFQVMKADTLLLSKNINGRAPWLEKTISVEHIQRAASRLNRPVSNIIDQIARFELLGMEMPDNLETYRE